MPVDHDAAPAIAGMPLGHQVAIPSPELRGIRCAGRSSVTPDRCIANCKRGIGNPSASFPQSSRVNEAAVYMKKFFIAGIGGGTGHPLQPGIGAETIEAKKQSLIQNSLRQRNAGGNLNPQRTTELIDEMRAAGLPL
jgi:hypothetical protein